MKIYILSQGGLGNQLFQANYAHYLSLAFPRTKVVFVNHNIANDREFALKGFFANCPHVHEVAKFELRTDFVVRVYRSIIRRLPKFSQFIKPFLGVIESENAYEGVQIPLANFKFLRFLPITLRVIGHFQSTSLVVPDSCFEESLISFIDSNKSGIPNYPSGVIHVRQGDYFQNFSMGPIALVYFNEVLNSLNDKKIDFVIHSDAVLDTSWIPNWVKLKQNKNITANAFDCLHDAGHSKIFIGSNSSLSWWASYLQNLLNDSAVSILPNEWMRGLSTNDLPIHRKNWILHNVKWN